MSMLRRFLRVLATVLVASTGAESVYAQSVTVTDVLVDATAPDAVQARRNAIEQGQAEALETALKRLAPPGSADSIRRPSVETAAAAVESVEIADEQIGATRYRARLTVAFAPDAIDRLLGQQGITGAVSTSRILVLPLARTAESLDLWSEDNPWRTAWVAEAERPGSPELVIPLGDLQDIATIDAAAAERGDVAALSRLASRYDATRVVVAAADVDAPPSQGVPVLLRGTGPDGALPERRLRGPGASSADDALVAAVEAARRGLVAPVASGPVSRVVAVVPLADLPSWVQIRGRLEGVPEIRDVIVREYARREARVELAYAGALAGLQAGLSRSGLGLVQENGGWRLQQGGRDAAARGTLGTTSPSP